MSLIKEELNVKQVEFKKADGVDSGDVVVELDTTLTPELLQEGLAREMVRAIQGLRKKVKYALSDSVKLFFQTKDQELAQAIERFKDYIEQKTLSRFASEPLAEFDLLEEDLSIHDRKISIALKKI